MSWLDMLSRFGSSAPVASAAPSGGNVSGYTNFDLSNFTPGAVAPQVTNPAVPAGMVGANNGGFMSNLFGSMFDTTDANGIKTQGWGGLALSGLQGLGNSYMGMKQYGLAEDALKEQKRQFNINYEAQRKMTNAQLSDRQRARVASNPGAYASEAEYMKQWGI